MSTITLNPSEQYRTTARVCPQCAADQAKFLIAKDGYNLMECAECELAFIENPPNQEKLAEIYSFDSGYHADFETDRKLQQQFLRRGRMYLRYLQKHVRRGRLLDVGCSAGFFLEVAGQSGFQPEGLEFSQDTADLAQRLYGHPIHHGSLSDEILPKKSFDVVTLWDVIEHVPEPLNDLQHIHSVLKPGGVVAMSTPNIGGFYPQVSYQLLPYTGYWSHPGPPYHLSQFSEKTLGSLLKRTGFEILGAVHRQIPLSYNFGNFRDVIRSPKRLAYAALLSPTVVCGPWLRKGDEIVMFARKQD